MSRVVSLLAKNGGARRFLSDVTSPLAKAQSEGAIPVTREVMVAELKAVMTEMGRLEDRMAGEFKSVRSEMAGEFEAVRAEMAGEFEAVRAEMAGGFKAVRAEMASEFKILGGKMDNQHRYMNRMIAGAGTAFLATVGLFGVYTLENGRSIGKLEGRLESLGQKPDAGAVHAPTPAPSLKK